MNSEVFNQLIKTPSKVDPKHKDELKKLVDTFPYSSNIRLLYLSALLNDADVLFEQELKKTAAYITDRRILKKLIEPITTSSENYIIEEAPMEVVQDEPKAETIEAIDSSTSDSKTETLIEQKESVELEINYTSTEISVTVPVLEEEEEASAPVILPEEQEKETQSQKVDELDQLILASAVNASLTLEIDEVAEEIQREREEAEPEGQANVFPNEVEGPKSFLEWIGADTSALDQSDNLDPKEKERREFRKKAESLIDQFIQNQPKIKPKAEFYSPENMAQKSVEDKGEIVTETLAKVYATQGNKAKAKAIYEQLILNNPEKKIYFASLLKKLGED